VPGLFEELLPLVWEFLACFCLFFTLSAFYKKTITLTSLTCFFDIAVIAFIELTVMMVEKSDQRG